MKNLMNLGKVLNKKEQTKINGGAPDRACFGQQEGDSCTINGYTGTCVYPWYTTDYLYCELISS
jgi:hypothetical protein